MTPGHLPYDEPYDDPARTGRTTADCRAVAAVLRPAPSIRFEDQRRDAAEPRIEVSAAAARLAAALYQQD
jgi:hypothetical protein